MYRRVYVPVDNVEAWPRDGEKYLPIEMREFEALVAAANRRVRTAGAIIVEATYSARLEGDRLVAGHGEWKIELHGEAPALLPLGEMSLILRDPRWKDDSGQPNALGSNNRAIVGTWGTSGEAADVWGLEVTRSGVLEFDWHSRSGAGKDTVDIQWSMPVAAATRLVLDLPEGKLPVVDGGIVVQSRPLPGIDGPDSNVRWRWELALAASNDVMLRIVDVMGAGTNTSSQFSLREDVAYEASERGLQIEALLQFDEMTREVRELVVPLPSNVQLISASSRNQALPWQVISTDSAGASAVVTLPDASSEGPLRVTLRAWQPPLLNEPWQLPKLRPVGSQWTAGSLEFALSPTLVLQRLKSSGCQQTKSVQPSESSNLFESCSFVAFSPDAKVELTVTSGAPEVTAQLESSLALADSDVKGILRTRLQVTRGNLHKLSGEVAPGWTIETVETDPPDALEEWFADRKQGRGEIEIQLAPSAEAVEELTIIASGRLQRTGITQGLPTETLRMVRWHDARVQSHLLTFQTVEPYVVEPTGGLPSYNLERFDGDRPVKSDALGSTGPQFDLTAPPADAALRVAVRPGQYEADIWVDATCDTDQLRIEYHIMARPKASQIDRLLIYATQRLGENVQWVVGQEGTPLVAERLASGSLQRADAPAHGETWSVRLPHATGTPVELAASIDIPWSERKSLALISVPEAVEQHGRVLVRGNAGCRPLVEVEAMRTIPLPFEFHEAESNQRPSVLAAYRYDPAECLSFTEAPALRIATNDFAGFQPIIASRAVLESYCMLDGRTVNRAEYHLQHQGAGRLTMRIPADSKLCSLSLDGRDFDPLADGKGKAISLPLSGDVESSVLTAYFETQAPRLRFGRDLRPPLLEIGSPLLGGDWTIWLPTEFSAIGIGSSLESRLTVRRRLFGLLGSSSRREAFTSVRRDDLRMGTGHVLADRTATKDTDRVQESRLGETVPPKIEFITATPREETAPDGQSAVTLAGWAAHEFSFIGERPAAVTVAQPAAMLTWSIAVFVACCAIGRWVWRRRRASFVAIVAIAAAFALLLPSVFSPLATGAFMGLLCSLLLSWPGRPLIEDSSTKTWQRPAAIAARLSILLAAHIVALVVGQVAFGQANSFQVPSTNVIDAAVDQNSHTAGTIHRVLIPVEANGDPAGTKTYVSERFLRELHGKSTTLNWRQWILLGADYQGELRESADRDDIVPGDWTMTFFLEVLSRDTIIVLPLVRDEATWPDSAMLDGIPVAINWADGGHGCSVHVAEPGQHEVVITCVPDLTETSDRCQIGLSIPPVPGASARLKHPRRVTGVTLAGSALVDADELGGELVGELDGSDHLSVDWPRASPGSGRGPGPRVTALQWLRIGVDEAVLDTKYIIVGNASRTDSLSIEADNRWELLQPNLSPGIESGFDGGQTFQIALPENQGDRHAISLRWRLAEAPALGRFRLPRVELTSLPVNQRWLAISSASALKVEVVGGENASPGTANEFMAMWGAGLGSIPPETVLAQVETAPDLVLAVEPRTADTSIDELLHVAGHDDGLRVHYEASVMPVGNDQFQLELAVSDEVTIDKVLLTQGGDPIALRWARDAEGILTIFFSRPLPSQFDVAISGHVPAAEGGIYKVPRVGALGGKSPKQLQLYGAEDVHVGLTGASETAALAASPLESAPAGWTVAPAGAFELLPESARSTRLIVAPNRVEASGESHTIVSREADGWWATFRCRLKVHEGRMDSLKLAAPSTWKGPIEIKSNVRATLETQAEEERRTSLSVRFSEPLTPGQDLELQLRGRVQADASEPISVPDIAVSTGLRGPRFVSVPTKFDSRPISWSESGMRRARARDDLPTPVEIDSSWATYEITSTPFHMILRPAVLERPEATVRLVDTFVGAGPLRNRLVYTRMVVVSQNLQECILEVPQDQELLRVSSDGRPAAIRPQGESQWRLTLGPSHFPQFIEFLSRSRSDDDADDSKVRLGRPRLLISGAPIAVEMSLWSFCDSRNSEEATMLGADRVDAAQQAAARLDRLVSISEAATPAALDASFPDGYHWYHPWAARLHELEQETLRAAGTPSGATTISQVKSATEEQIARTTERLDAWLETCDSTLALSDLDPMPPISYAEALLTEPPMELTGSHWIHGVAEGGEPAIFVEHRNAAKPMQSRLAALAVVGLAAIVSVSLLRRPAAWDVVCRWPHAIAFLLGIAYWAALWPSWIGIVIATASALLALRSGWPGRLTRAEGSTVLRLPPR